MLQECEQIHWVCPVGFTVFSHNRQTFLHSLKRQVQIQQCQVKGTVWHCGKATLLGCIQQRLETEGNGKVVFCPNKIHQAAPRVVLNQYAVSACLIWVKTKREKVEVLQGAYGVCERLPHPIHNPPSKTANSCFHTTKPRVLQKPEWKNKMWFDWGA